MAAISYGYGNKESPVLLKRSLLSIIEKKLKREKLKVAKNDSHSKRKPISCGLTVHPGSGCPLQCSYCYIYDMGFNTYATPYSLEGLQLVAALLYNKYFYPTRWGTYLAFGSVTEPFLPNIMPKTLEYLKAVSEYLGNPCQVSTKMVIHDEVIEELVGIKDLKISFLITVTSLRQFLHLEEKAPHPFKRLENLKRLRKKGFKPFVFLRPLLPGLSDEELSEIVDQARASGAYGIVIGNLRLSQNIIKRLLGKGINLSKLFTTDFRSLKKGFIDIRVNGRVLSCIRERALERGLIFVKRACCANTLSQYLQGHSDVVCPSLCFLNENVCEPTCPSQCRRKALGEPNHIDMYETIGEVLGSNKYEVDVENHVISIKLKESLRDEKSALFSLMYLLRRKIRFIKST
ncbi:MAG: radical SAM protein [Candidatus Nezhaarchaeales archaeon]